VCEKGLPCPQLTDQETGAAPVQLLQASAHSTLSHTADFPFLSPAITLWLPLTFNAHQGSQWQGLVMQEASN
jgi:hypothetical protein